MVAQGGGDNGGEVEGLLALRLARGCAEVAECGDADTLDHDDLRLPLAFRLHAEHCLLPQADSHVMADFLNIVLHTHHVLLFGLRLLDASTAAFCSSSLRGTGFLRLHSSHLSSSS